MTNQEKRFALEMFIGSSGVGRVYSTTVDDLREALHSANELRLWPDNVDSVSVEQAMLCWKLIERLKESALPAYLKM